LLYELWRNPVSLKMEALSVIQVEQIRKDFPILSEKVYGKPIVYFDNGATTQKPRVVIDTISKFYNERNSSVHRGVHFLSEKSTEAYEQARETIRQYINAASTNEIIFTSGATGSINAVAFSFGEKFIKAGDEIMISGMEHHANIVPWQMLCERKNACLKVFPFKKNGELDLEKYSSLFSEKTRLVAFTHVSNTLGTINPVEKMIRLAHQHNVPVLVDGAQAIQHGRVDVRDMDCDFYVFSGHKVFGPNGIGVLYGKEKWLDELPPYQGGGEMIESVTFEKTTYNALPLKFEAGTTNYVGAVGLKIALDSISSIGLGKITGYEKELLEYATEKLTSIDGLEIYGTAGNKISIISFLLDNIHQYDAGMVLDKLGIAVRTGAHCNQPVMDYYGISGTIRASMVFYNTKEEIDRLYEGLLKVQKMFR
jgi:cysteine desulfurase/selenocysteine lyase